MLTVEGLRSRYGRIEVLHGIDLAVESGEIVTVVAPMAPARPRCCAACRGCSRSRPGPSPFAARG